MGVFYLGQDGKSHVCTRHGALHDGCDGVSFPVFEHQSGKSKENKEKEKKREIR